MHIIVLTNRKNRKFKSFYVITEWLQTAVAIRIDGEVGAAINNREVGKGYMLYNNKNKIEESINLLVFANGTVHI